MEGIKFCLYVVLLSGIVTAAHNETQRYEERVPDEQRLFQEIMDGYEIAVRPSTNTSGVITVKFGLRLNQIIDLDERHQILTTSVFIDQVWQDLSLSWNPEDFNNLQSMRIPSHRVWLPDTFIYNNADGSSTGFVAGQYVLVCHNGNVKWPVPVKLHSSCQVNIKYFPFDDQFCVLRFGSWIYNDQALSFVPLEEDHPIDMQAYVNNSEWDLLSATLEKSKRQESCCVEPHTDLVYKLHIRRRTFFYVFNVIIPCIMLSVLTLLTFWVPATSGEKVTLGLSVFLAFSMFMLLIAEEVPASSESVPLIGIYLCCVMTMTSFSVIMAVLVINLYHRGVRTPRAPAWLRYFCLTILSTLLCITHDIKAIAETITLDEEEDDADRKPAKTRQGQNTKGRGKDSPNQGNGHARNVHQVEVHPRKAYRTNIKQKNVGWLGYDHNRGSLMVTRNLSSVGAAAQCPTPSTSNHEAIDTIFDVPQPQASSAPHTDSDSDKSDVDESCNHRDQPNAAETTCSHDKFHDGSANPVKDEDQALLTESSAEKTDTPTPEELLKKKVAIVEWQRIAAVIDRLQFWVFFLGTLTAYLIILVFIPGNKKIPWDTEVSPLHAVLHQS